MWFDFVGAALISAANPPLDAARLDIMPSGLWGRAESTRTFLRSLAQALAPLLFGAVADLVAGFEPQQAPVGTHTHAVVSSATGTGLQVSLPGDAGRAGRRRRVPAALAGDLSDRRRHRRRGLGAAVPRRAPAARRPGATGLSSAAQSASAGRPATGSQTAIRDPGTFGAVAVIRSISP